MQNKSFKKPNNKGNGDTTFWVLVVIFFIFCWPLALIMLALKYFPMIKAASSAAQRDDLSVKSRFERYLLIVQGYDTMSIASIASAAGVSYETALRELQQLLAEGRFGKSAYINYLTKTLVLNAEAVRPKGSRPAQTAQTAQTTQTTQAAQAAQAQKSQPTQAQKSQPTQAQKSQPAQKAQSAPGGLDRAMPIKLYGGIKILLLVFGIIFLVAGIGMFADALDTIALFGFADSTTYEWYALLQSIFWCLGGGACLFIRRRFSRRVSRFNKLKNIVGSKTSIEISKIAEVSGMSVKDVRRDLEAMIEKGLFGQTAYIDIGADVLVLDPSVKLHKEEPEKEQASENQYYNILKEIRTLNDEIADPAVSERIYKIEDLTGKIFHIVEEKPEKQPQIKSFMSYYLPTTLKLLHSYSLFEKQGISGENIDEARKDIERILDTLVQGYTQQLDQLFQSDAMDISADINVLESMMQKDGLSGESGPFATASK